MVRGAHRSIFGSKASPLSSLSHYANGAQGQALSTPYPCQPSRLRLLQLTGRVLESTRREEGHPLPWSLGGGPGPPSLHPRRSRSWAAEGSHFKWEWECVRPLRKYTMLVERCLEIAARPPAHLSRDTSPGTSPGTLPGTSSREPCLAASGPPLLLSCMYPPTVGTLMQHRQVFIMERVGRSRAQDQARLSAPHLS